MATSTEANPGAAAASEGAADSAPSDPHLNHHLAALGFHRIGRLDEVGRRSLWLREERGSATAAGAIELRAGREGDDAAVRITAENPLYLQLSAVLDCARFAAEYEVEGGTALNESYALDQYEESIHRMPATNATTVKRFFWLYDDDVDYYIVARDLDDAKRMIREAGVEFGDPSRPLDTAEGLTWAELSADSAAKKTHCHTEDGRGVIAFSEAELGDWFCSEW